MYKFLCTVIILTTLSLGYVAQQVKLVEYSYRINDSRKRLCLLIDENEGLRYNVASLKSPASLKRRLASSEIELNVPQKWHSIRLAKAKPKKEEALTYDSSFKIAATTLVNILTPKAEAIAQELD